MAREVTIGGRRYWILSEPGEKGWTAKVVEILDEAGQATEEVGIDARGATRAEADEAALRKLQRLLKGATD